MLSFFKYASKGFYLINMIVKKISYITVRYKLKL